MADSSPSGVAIVTGAARGIGAAVTAQLLADGWTVVGLDLDAADAADGLHVLTGDVTTQSAWDEATALAASLGELRGVVNNAGAQGPGTLLRDTSLEDFGAVLAVNAASAFLGTRAGLRAMPDGGAIVNLASNAGSRGVPRYGAYVAGKHAVIGLTRTAALEGARAGVRVNAVAPGPTQTRIMDDVAASFDAPPDETLRKLVSANPSRRFGEPAEIAQAIVWLLGPQSSYVTGAVIAVDGGLTAG